MAYMSQENKKEIAPQIKAVLKKYNMKGSIAVRHHSTLVVNIKSGDLDVIGNWMQKDYPVIADLKAEGKVPTNLDVNTYWIEDHYTGKVSDFLTELKDAMNGKGSDGEANFDKSDIMTDYFHVGWYISINVGQWDKPYVFTGDSTQITEKDLEELNEGFVNPPKIVKLNVRKPVDLWAESAAKFC